MPKRVLILRSTPLDSDPWVARLAHALADAGHAVEALGWDGSGMLPEQESASGFPLSRLRVSSTWPRPLGGLAARARYQSALLGWLGKRHAGLDVLHVCDAEALPAALAAKRLWGLKVVYDLRNSRAPTRRLALRPADLVLIGQADALILSDESQRGRLGRAAPPILDVIYDAPPDCLAELERGEPPPRPPEVRLRLAYSGPLRVECGLLALLEVLGAHPEWSLDLAGPGAEKGLILREARQLPNVTIHGLLPVPRALELAFAADVLPALYDPAYAGRSPYSPLRLFEGMMLARPLLGARGSGYDGLFERLGCGLLVEYGSVKRIAQALGRLEDPDLRQRLGGNGRRAYEQAYSWEKMSARLVSLYHNII